MDVYVVSYREFWGKDTIVTVFDNEKAAMEMYNLLKDSYITSVDLCPVYKEIQIR